VVAISLPAFHKHKLLAPVLCTQVLHNRTVRQFRQDLADYIDGDEPITITRHGRRIGIFIPTRSDRVEAIEAYRAATEKLHALMAKQDIDEDEVVAEFNATRNARRETTVS